MAELEIDREPGVHRRVKRQAGHDRRRRKGSDYGNEGMDRVPRRWGGTSRPNQDRSIIGVFTSKVQADNAAGKELRAAIKAGKVPYYNPRTKEECVDWEVDTGTDGPYEVDRYESVEATYSVDRQRLAAALRAIATGSKISRTR
jgi:hypothetical protein